MVVGLGFGVGLDFYYGGLFVLWLEGGVIE